MLKNFITKITGDPAEKLVKQLRQRVERANALEPTLKAMSDDDLRAQTHKFKAALDEAALDLREEVAQAQREFDELTGDERRQAEDRLKAAKKALYEAEAEVMDDILEEAFATVREAAHRTIGQR
ncbi:MAG: preprotein translocase subunit SecA, partial [Anaerolineae bacterium]|nr:preprotein translocase subunit SecA [Anaerolineae bacterium]